MSGKWDFIVFYLIILKIFLCLCGKFKILFLVVFEIGFVCNESEEFVWFIVFYGKFEFRGLFL